MDEVQKRDIVSEHKYSFKRTKTADKVANVYCVMEYCSDPQYLIQLDW